MHGKRNKGKKTANTIWLVPAIIASLCVFAPDYIHAEEKFLDRNPQPSSYSALCQYYRQEDLPSSQSRNAIIADFRGCDLSRFDLSSYSKEEAERFVFDTSTVWPDRKLMPKGFNPDKAIRSGKKTANLIRKIRNKADSGKGYAVGIIGKSPLLSHKEFEGNQPVYTQQTLSPLANRESTAALAILSGRNSGILPKSVVHYVAPLSYGKTSGARDMYPEAKALRDLLIYNREQLSPENRIRAVAMLYRDYPIAIDGMVTLGKAKKDAEQQGVAIFTGDDLEQFRDYKILPDEMIMAAATGSDKDYAIIPPSSEIMTAWLAGLYITAIRIDDSIDKTEFFWLLKKTAKISSEDEKNYKKIVKKAKKEEKKQKNDKKSEISAVKMPEMPKKTLQPLKMLEILRKMQ